MNEPVSKKRMLDAWLAIVIACASGIGARPAHAQQSVSYKVKEFVLNEGGHPQQGTPLVSTSYRVRLDAVGEGLTARLLTSASYRAEAGFVSGYPPPGEPLALRFSDGTTLLWNSERSAGTYNVYRELVETLPGSGFGACFASGLAAATATEPSDPPEHSGWFYLVTAENRLGEEGTKGRRSDGVVRGNTAPCP